MAIEARYESLFRRRRHWSLAAAAFMIRDGGMPGQDITIFEGRPCLGGSLDGGGDADRGYTLRGGRMLTTDNYECTWDLLSTIPRWNIPARASTTRRSPST